MKGIIDLNELLDSLGPELQDGEFVFCTVPGSLHDYAALDPLASFKETEGLTLILPVQTAVRQNFRFEGRFKCITLTVHSSLDAVGLTAAVSTKLASKGIPANIVAANYHDHVFVPNDKAPEALTAIQDLSMIKG